MSRVIHCACTCSAVHNYDSLCRRSSRSPIMLSIFLVYLHLQVLLLKLNFLGPASAIHRKYTTYTVFPGSALGPDGLCFFSGLLFYSFILRSFTYYSFHPAHYSLIFLTTIYSTYYINVRNIYNTEQYNLLDCNRNNCKYIYT